MRVVELGYVACNWDSLLLAGGFGAAFAAAVVALKLAAAAEIYAAEGTAVPALYYLGDKRGVRAAVQRAVVARRARPRAENFQGLSGEPAVAQHASLAELADAHLAAPLRALAAGAAALAARARDANADIARAHDAARSRAAAGARALGEKVAADFGR